MQSIEITKQASQPLVRWTAISSLALIAVTWRLWTPQSVYPQVPLFESLCAAPLWLDWLGLGGAIVGLIALTITNRTRVVRISCVIVIVSLLLLFSLDQHRFQPWAYELLLCSCVWLCCHDRLRLRLLRWLLISVYFYSAIGKFDFEFLHTVGQQMLAVVVRTVWLDANDWPLSTRITLVALFPIIELATAIALVWPRTRRVGGWLAIGLHLGLIAILGPLGLNHRAGVLVWNLQVAVQVYWLFISKRSNEPEEVRMSLPQWVATSIVGVAIFMPSTERFGVWDHWPSWALYAPHSSRVSVEVAEPVVDRLPERLRGLVSDASSDSEDFAIWIKVPIDSWSLQSLDTPIYPQARFQLGVAQAIARDVNVGFEIRVTVLGTASRFTGSRRSIVYEGNLELSNASKHFWFNCRPRNQLNTP